MLILLQVLVYKNRNYVYLLIFYFPTYYSIYRRLQYKLVHQEITYKYFFGQITIYNKQKIYFQLKALVYQKFTLLDTFSAVSSQKLQILYSLKSSILCFSIMIDSLQSRAISSVKYISRYNFLIAYQDKKAQVVNWKRKTFSQKVGNAR